MIYPSELEGLELTGPKRSFCEAPETDKGVIIPQTSVIPRRQNPWPSPRVMTVLSVCEERRRRKREGGKAFLAYMNSS